MIHIDQMKIGIEEIQKGIPKELLKRGVIGTEEEMLVRTFIAKKIRISSEEMKDFRIIKKSVDARKKAQIFLVYQVQFSCKNEKKFYEKNQKRNVTLVENPPLGREPLGTKRMKEQMGKKKNSPVVVGFGPAGIFGALILARAGLEPFVVERGMDAGKRKECVEQFWRTGILNPESNVQFGEGGAGTFSDGKLNTMVKDRTGKNRQVLETLVEFGAPPEILYLQRPHIGTDRLQEVVTGIRKEIIRFGGSVSFETKVVDFCTEDGRLRGVVLEKAGKRWERKCQELILATGHSARDIFYRLKELQVKMEPKAFAVGVRVEHPQELIGKNQYGRFHEILPAAEYKLTYQTEKNRGVYSFCMCPGGYVVNSSSEEKGLVVNGMSDYLRDGKNANSAIVVTVSPADFSGEDVLSGVEFQKKYERAAFLEAGGKIPVQLFSDFLRKEKSSSFGGYLPQMKGEYAFGNLRNILPEFVGEAIAEGMKAFGKRIQGYDREDAVLSGIESRTSSPVRILRNEHFLSSVTGLYPCGEGAGYAGGITSAAMDGIRVAEEIVRNF